MTQTITAAEVDGKPSFDDIRTLLNKALNPSDTYGIGTPWIVDIGEKSCIVAIDRKNYRYPYELSTDGQSVTLGSPEPVKVAWEDVAADGAVAASEGLGNPLRALSGELLPLGQSEPGTLAFVTDLKGLQFSEGGKDTVRIEVCRDGTWKHPKYGDVKVTPETRQKFAENFNSNVRKVGDLPLDYDHREGPASGWIKDLHNEGNAMFADVELTPTAREKVRSGEYRFFSPEWHPDWQDPETGTKHGPTLFGGGITNRPFFRGMAAICCSEMGAQRPEESMNDTSAGAAQNTEPQKAAEPVKATEPQVTSQQFAELQQRMQAIEAENATLKAAEQRRSVESALEGMRFSEGRSSLAPASRTVLVDALMPLPSDAREKVLEAVGKLQFAELNERGFTPAENAGSEGSLTASEEADLKKMAESHGLKFEEVKATYLETKKDRAAASKR